MSSNSTGKNIGKAFEVVYKTYENVQKLLSFLKSQSEEKGEYVCCSEKILCWSSDQSIWGWAYHSFILVFQNAKNTELENGWRDGSLYIAEINLVQDDEPLFNIARFDYADVENWSSDPITKGNHWIFNHPLHDTGKLVSYNVSEDGYDYDGIVVNEEKADKTYWGIRRVVGTSFPLTDITAENAYEKVFGGFDELAGK